MSKVVLVTHEKSLNGYLKSYEKFAPNMAQMNKAVQCPKNGTKNQTNE